jgi:hypothetical protein
MIARITEKKASQRYSDNRYHRMVLGRFEEVLAENANAPLHLAENLLSDRQDGAHIAFSPPEASGHEPDP